MITIHHMAIIVAGLVCTAAAAPPPVYVNGCRSTALERFDAGQTQAGPLRLAMVTCVDFAPDRFGASNPILSPDGAHVARWHEGSPAPIEIVAYDKPGRVSVPSRVGSIFRSYAAVGGIMGTAPDAVAWRSDSRALLAIRQETVVPSGSALSGLVPISIASDGTVRDFPRLHHPAGPLDGLMWIGGNGLALAQFGSRGDNYRPQHDDPDPTLAMVDAASGRVLDSVPALSIPSLRERVQEWGLRVNGASSAILPDRRIRAVVQVSRWWQQPPGTVAGENAKLIMRPPVWLIWTQGETPLEWPTPFPNDFENPMSLTPDGSKLLVVRELQPDGVRLGHLPDRMPPPPPPTPVSGSVAELFDVASQQVVWRVPATAIAFWRQRAPPAISGDGRYALVEVPPGDDRAPIALVDMRNGRVVQTFAPFHQWSHQQSFGFTADGRRVWVACSNMILFYELSRL